MESAYFGRLAADTQGLISRVEEHIGAPVEVKVHAEPRHLTCAVMGRSPVIYTYDPSYFPDDSVIHEFVHIHRVRVQGVPQVVCTPDEDDDPQLGLAFRRLDNNLEHFVIVPEELHMRPGRREWWERRMELVWGERIPSLSCQEDQKRQALLNWAFSEHVLPGARTRGLAQEMLERLRVADQAERFREELVAALGSKRDTVQVCLRHFGLASELARLRHIDPQYGHAWLEQI